MFYSSDEISPEASVEPEIEMAQFCRKSDIYFMNNIFSSANLSPLDEGLCGSGGGPAVRLTLPTKKMAKLKKCFLKFA